MNTAEEQAVFEALLVADLRVTASRYPTDPSLARLVHELSASSPRFVELWESSEPELRHELTRHKIIDTRPSAASPSTATALVVAVDELRLMVYTAEPGTEDAERLALAIVLGTETFVG